MNGKHPGGVTPEELIAYLDGEAPPQVAAHVRDCQECTAAAGAYARVQQRLGSALHRFDCPSPQRLGDYELGLLAPEERRLAAAHVVECPRCAEELRTLRDFLAAEAAAPAAGPVEWVRRVVATLLAPPPRTVYAGLRGAEDATTQTYQAGDVKISLSTLPGGRRGQASLAGLIWREGAEEALAGTTVALTAGDGAMDATEIDDLGNFTFDEVTPGTYRLEVMLGDHIVVIEGLRIGR